MENGKGAPDRCEDDIMRHITERIILILSIIKVTYIIFRMYSISPLFNQPLVYDPLTAIFL